MECPKCNETLKGRKYLYTCESCETEYEVNFKCEVCGSEPEVLASCGAVSFYCNSCNNMKSRTTMNKEFIKKG